MSEERTAKMEEGLPAAYTIDSSRRSWSIAETRRKYKLLLPSLLAALEEYEHLEKENAWLRAETECPDCKCSTPQDAECKKCGCDSAVCSRTTTLAQAYTTMRRELEEAWQSDSVKTTEINVLVRENNTLRDQLAEAQRKVGLLSVLVRKSRASPT